MRSMLASTLRIAFFTASLVVFSLDAPVASSQALSCEFKPWRTYKSAELFRHTSADVYFFVTDHMRIDADGAPNAYGPGNIGLDLNANAGYPSKSWWPNVLVPDPSDPNRALVQKSGAFKGYFVSQTALADRSLPQTDPRAYVDATEFPYLVFPGKFAKQSGTGRLGDFGYAIHLENGRTSPFIVADIGPSNAKLGEVSIALAEALGGENVNPRNGAGQPKGKVAYVVFRFSSDPMKSKRWRLADGEIEMNAEQLLSDIGGLDPVKSCFD